MSKNKKINERKNYHDVIVIGAGVSGIYQIYCLTKMGMDAILLEGDEDLGGTWYHNRYPGCRFDTESYTYAYSFSKELCNEWHWKERFSSQPENLKYLNFVADKFDLRRHMTFNTFIDSMEWVEEQHEWTLHCRNGETYHTRFVVTSMGGVHIPTYPRIDGLDDFKGQSFHSRSWPREPLDLKGKRVGVVGVGATGIQIIQTIAAEVGELYVFQRRPNWSAPLNNSPISEEEMADIRERYDEIFAKCNSTASGMEHVVDSRDFWSLTKEERIATWDKLYDEPGFSILAGNFSAIYTDEAANKEISDYIANRIRQRVDDPVIAEKLIPKDHGFGIQRLPLETNYFETYNRDNVHLVDIMEAPIERVTATGIKTTDSHYDLDLIVYATGYDTITGSYEAVNPSGVNGTRLKDKWVDGPLTYFGVMTHGFPNLLMVPGPQAASGGSNFPRAIEVNANGVTKILKHALANEYTRVEAELAAEQWWLKEVTNSMERLLMSKATKGWIIGENSNIEGRDGSKKRYVAYWGGGARFTKLFNNALSDNFRGFKME